MSEHFSEWSYTVIIRLKYCFYKNSYVWRRDSAKNWLRVWLGWVA